jgi:hypothetical protein
VDLANLGSESKTCVGSRVCLVGVPISFEKKFLWAPIHTPLSGSPYQSFRVKNDRDRQISIQRLRKRAGARRRRTAAVSGERWRAAAISPVCLYFEVGGLDFERGLNRGEACEAANLSRVAQPAEARRQRCGVQWGGGYSGELPTMTRGMGMSTSGTRGLLTSLHDSGAAP